MWSNSEKICAFFGNEDCPLTRKTEAQIKRRIMQLIRENYRVFLLRDHGHFNFMVSLVLAQLQEKGYAIYPFYLNLNPHHQSTPAWADIIEQRLDNRLPLKQRRQRRTEALYQANKLMIEQADTVVCYISQSYGVAYETMILAQNQNKRVFNLCPFSPDYPEYYGENLTGFSMA